MSSSTKINNNYNRTGPGRYFVYALAINKCIWNFKVCFLICLYIFTLTFGPRLVETTLVSSADGFR